MRTLSVSLFALALVACKDVGSPTEDNPGEVITTVVLAFTPSGGGAATEFSWADPENDGDPVIDAISLSDAEDYTVEVSFLNELEDPAEDITVEVDAESDEHQVFFTGTAVASGGPLTHTYDDTDANGFPVGLSSTLATNVAGSGTLTVTLRHLPPEDGTAVKTGDLATTAATEGVESLPGDTDASVDFAVTVE